MTSYLFRIVTSKRNSTIFVIVRCNEEENISSIVAAHQCHLLETCKVRNITMCFI